MHGGYPNEAQVSVSIVLPVLRELGWDDADPQQVCPEYGSGGGRVDFALMGANHRPAVFVEVKGIGRSVSGQGERQLFEYAFHEGVPLCVLTDGRDWNFHLPGAQGSYDNRRVHRLLLDERPIEDCKAMLTRYLARDRVCSGAAWEDAQRDYRDSMRQREAERALPGAWRTLLDGADDLLVEMLADRAEGLCGIRPQEAQVAAFLRGQAGMASNAGPVAPRGATPRSADPVSIPAALPRPPADRPGVPAQPAAARKTASSPRQSLVYRLLGTEYQASNARQAFVDILRQLVAHDPSRVPELAAAVKGRTRNHVARSQAEIYPQRPDLADAEEIGAGWLVGLNISNRDKQRILVAACDAWGLRWGEDLAITLPNA